MASDQLLKSPIKKVSKVSQLLLGEYHNINNFLVSRYIAKMVALLQTCFWYTVAIIGKFGELSVIRQTT